MSRKILIKKRFFKFELKYNSFLVNLLINRILKKGKKELAKRIVYTSLNLLENKMNKNPIFILEKAIRNLIPRVKLQSKKIGGSTHQVPIILNRFKGVNLAIRWLTDSAKKRIGKNIIIKLTNEILDCLKYLGNSIKKKEETHKMAEANKAFLQIH
jgi:small subunit ribosomal protein S7